MEKTKLRSVLMEKEPVVIAKQLNETGTKPFESKIDYLANWIEKRIKTKGMSDELKKR